MDLLRDIATQFKQGRGKSGTFSGTTDGNGFLSFPHGMTQMPSQAFAFTNNGASAPNLAIPFLYAIDGLNITLSFFALTGSAAGLAVAGSWLAFV